MIDDLADPRASSTGPFLVYEVTVVHFANLTNRSGDTVDMLAAI